MPLSKYQGSPEAIIAEIERLQPGATALVDRVQTVVPYLKRQVWPWQAMVLYHLASQYNRDGAWILEIGTAWGYSAAVMATACPKAKIITLNPKETEYPYAVKHLAGYGNVYPLKAYSDEYRVNYEGEMLDMVFVDGDHSFSGVMADLQWYKHLKVGGLILFHDYAPEGAKRPCPPVKSAVDTYCETMELSLDILIQDLTGTGMAGIIKAKR